jgi:steroid delta-isomerase-like uncharacterized protein
MTLNEEHAQHWAAVITADTDAAVDLFAKEFTYDDRRDVDHVFDTATDKGELRARIAPFANKDVDNGLGVHRFEVLDVIDGFGANGSRAIAIVWQWTGEHLENFRGVPTGGQILTARGQTWHQLDDEGKVTRESTFWNDVPVFQQLGLPVLTPAYWEADFDLDAFLASSS